MKAYQLTKTRDGQRTPEIIDTYDNLEDAREALEREMYFIAETSGGCKSYFADKADINREIEFCKEGIEEGSDIWQTRLSNLLEVENTPCLVDDDYNLIGCITDDHFHYDSHTFAIKEVELEDEED